MAGIFGVQILEALEHEEVLPNTGVRVFVTDCMICLGTTSASTSSWTVCKTHRDWLREGVEGGRKDV